jgi:hypothetical protein
MCMTHRFDDDVIGAVLAHMNGDHDDDNLLIAKAFCSQPDVISARMVGFDGEGGDWRVLLAGGDEVVVRVDWPGGPIDERPAVRREIVALYDESCRLLGIEPRPHA